MSFDVGKCGKIQRRIECSLFLALGSYFDRIHLLCICRTIYFKCHFIDCFTRKTSQGVNIYCDPLTNKPTL